MDKQRCEKTKPLLEENERPCRAVTDYQIRARTSLFRKMITLRPERRKYACTKTLFDKF